MKSIRRRTRLLLTVVALVSTLAAVALFKRGSNTAAFSLLQTNDIWRLMSKNTDPGRQAGGRASLWPLTQQHPSVFQHWRARQPQRRNQTPRNDCSFLAATSSSTAVTACERSLKRVGDYCSGKMAVEEQMEKEEESQREDTSGGAAKQEEGVVDVHSVRRGRLVVLYCPVHKAASTFWLRVFRFLHHDTPPHLTLDRPEELSKFQVHMSPFKSSRAYALAYLTRTMIRAGDKEFRFMISRDPYQRLWSVYVDKFVLPDHYFWSHHAQAIKRMEFLSMAMTTTDERGKGLRQNSTETNGEEGVRSKARNGHGRAVTSSHECPGDVSFENLVRYVVQDPGSPTAQRDDHLLPVTSLCDPCVFQPHFLGRFENLTEDSQAILGRMGLGQQQAGLFLRADFRERALSQIKTVTEFAQDSLRASLHLRHCVSDVQLQDRLLRAFVMSGYLPPEALLVPRQRVVTQVRQVREMMTRLFLRYNRSQEETEAQRRRFYVTAYAALPRELLLRLRGYYAEDFEAFGYDNEPSEFFGTRK